MPWSMPLPPMQPRDSRPAGDRCDVTLRDHFAAAALTGLLDGSDDVGQDWEYRVIACRDAYNWADAMLEARNQKPSAQ